MPIPRDKDKTGTLDQMEHRVKMQLRSMDPAKTLGQALRSIHKHFLALFELPIAANESSSSQLVKQFYRSCMDVQALQAQGLDPLKRAVQDFGGWPPGIDFGWNESHYAWEKSNAFLRSKYGVQALMIITVDYDFRNNTRKLITVTRYRDGPLNWDAKGVFVQIDQPDAENMNLVYAWKAARTRGKSLLHSALDNMVDLALEFGKKCLQHISSSSSSS